MFFNQDEYLMVQEATLNGKTFNEKQRSFIELLESKYVIAGPGTGKTTSLAAKIALLLLASIRKNQNEGICVITKTNVAVDEINRVLKKVGLTKLDHPHFVGTIHNFFNTYLATPYIQRELNPKNLRFGSEVDFLPILYSLGEKHSYFKNFSEGPRNATIRRISGSKLIFDPKRNEFDLENTTQWDRFSNHSPHMFNLKWSLKKLGCFSFDDIFLFSKVALTNEKIISLLRNRFKYVFIDEFQDTSKFCIDLIENIFYTNNNVVQFIGDPNQTLDFEGEMHTIDKTKLFSLNICNRFGKEIGKQLQYIVSEIDIECNASNASFNPVLLVYESRDKLINNYKNFFRKYLEDEKFSGKSRRDFILGIQNDSINDFLSQNEKNDISLKRKKLTESYTRQLQNNIYDLLMRSIPDARGNVFKVSEWLKDHRIYYKIKVELTNSIKTQKLNEDKFIELINLLIQEKDGNKINKSNAILKYIAQVIAIINTPKKPDLTPENDNEFVYSTIHSVKGETLRSVLLIDSVRDVNREIHAKLLKNSICNLNEDMSEHWVESNLLYVAMSRPTDLFTFAMNKSLISNDEIGIFKKKGWETIIVS